MPSTLELNKRAVIRLRQLISQHGGEYVDGNYGESHELVGSFAPMVFVHVVGTLPFSTETFRHIRGLTQHIQTCPIIQQDGAFASGQNYRLWDYRCRWAYHPVRDMFQYQEVLDDPDDSTRERWTPIMELC